MKTAKEFLEDYFNKESGIVMFRAEDMVDCMKDFAKLHVSECIKTAQALVDNSLPPHIPSPDIKRSYPLNLIK